MNTYAWFDDLPVLGRLPAPRAAEKLRELGENDLAAALEATQSRKVTKGIPIGSWWPHRVRAWQHTGHAFGFIGGASAEPIQPIKHAGSIEPDATLKRSRIRVTLDRLRVAEYPGSGTHRILLDFYAQNQVAKSTEHLHFNATYRVREGEQAPIIGFPIFVGLNVGDNGVSFRCYTVNVKNDSDEAFLSFLESDMFRAGLKLGRVAQPAIGPLSEMAVALTKAIASRNRNVPVQEFFMGLDFSRTPTSARLAEGSYAAVQVPETLRSEWNWTDWVYNTSTGQITAASDSKTLVPYNYVVFGISRYQED